MDEELSIRPFYRDSRNGSVYVKYREESKEPKLTLSVAVLQVLGIVSLVLQV